MAIAFISRNNFFRKFFIAAVWILLWQLTYVQIGKEILLVSPFAVFVRLLELIRTPSFWQSSFYSVLRILTGFALALIIGTFFAIVTSMSKFLYDFFFPVISVIKATPVASFILLAFLWLHSSNVPVFISFLMVFPVVWGNMLQGIKNTDIKLLEMSNIYKFGRLKRIKYIYIPSAMPYFMSAATIGLGLSWKAGIAAEVLSLPRNAIGTKLYEAKVYLDMADLFAWTVFVILISIIIEIMLVRFVNYIGGKIKIKA